MARMPISLDDERKGKWPKLAKKMGFGSTSHMIRYAVDSLENQETTTNSVINALKPLETKIAGNGELIKNTNEIVDIINMRFSITSPTSEVKKAQKDIVAFLSNGSEEENFSGLSGRFDYSKETLKQAISDLSDIGIIGSQLIKNQKNKTR